MQESQRWISGHREYGSIEWGRLRGAALLATLTFGVFCPEKSARADYANTDDFSLSGIYAPIGVNVGATLRSHGANGLLVGGEVSLLRYRERERYFWGAYVDYLYDRGARTHRVSVGPELGWTMQAVSVGLDVGPALELGGDRARLAIRPRIFASLLFLVLYAGETIRLTDGYQRLATEVGALLKFPVPVGTCTSKTTCDGRVFCTDDCSWGRW